MNNNKNKSVIIYDTTLRDGSQGEAISFSVASKLRICEKLDSFGIDYIEGGWPGSNPKDKEFFVKAKELNLKHSKISAFGSTRRANILAKDDVQVQNLIESGAPAIAIFGKSWLLHVEKVLNVSKEENLAMIADTISYLKSFDKEVFYDAEHFFDGYKDNPNYAIETLLAAQNAGADYLCLCDTNGGTMPLQLQEILKDVLSKVKIKVGVHLHNDCGLAVALSLLSVQTGASLVQGTINGYGERVGNANLTSIIPNLNLKLGYDVFCAKNMPLLRDLSLFIDDMANIKPNIKEPFVGSSAFAHKGGIHSDAISKISYSYEHIDPAKVGNKTRSLVSDMSGRKTIMMKAGELGITLDPKSKELKTFLDDLKDLEFKGYEFESANASFKLLIDKFLKNYKQHFEVLSYRVIVENQENSKQIKSEATVKLKVDDEITHTVAEANGPVAALDLALRKALISKYPQLENLELTDFKVRILDSGLGTNAITRVQIESTDNKEIWGSVGASDNIIEASWEALQDSMEYKLSQIKNNH